MLTVEHVTARHGDRTVLDDVSLTVDPGEVLAVLGPSGSGKSTLLRVVAGLHAPSAGRVRIDGVDVTGVPTHRRGVGLMFQQHALLPHRDVAGNVGFGPRMQGLPPAAVRERVDEALALVDLAGSGARDVTALSGGEQQRVALARAIAARPRLLLLDEPLGSLDRSLRARLLADLPPLLARLGLTTVTVTHDQEEAMALADRIAVVSAGRVLRVDTPEALWEDPQDATVARFLGLGPLLPAMVRRGAADTPLGALPAPGVRDGAHRVALLPGALTPTAERTAGTAAGPSLRVHVVERRFAGDRVIVGVLPAGAAADAASAAEGAVEAIRLALPRTTRTGVGETLEVTLDAARLRWFAPDDVAGGRTDSTADDRSPVAEAGDPHGPAGQ